jgi:hypothetical protein
MIKQIKKYIKDENIWLTVICENEVTIQNTFRHLQDQNPNDNFIICD